MSSPKFSPPTEHTNYAEANKRAEAQRQHIRSLSAQLDQARRERDLAELQARCLNRELQAARREIAHLQSLAPRQQDN